MSRTSLHSSDDETILDKENGSKHVDTNDVDERLVLDAGDEEVRTRGHFWEFWYAGYDAPLHRTVAHG